MAGLKSPAPTGVDHICNKTRLISWLLSMHFNCAFNLFNAFFYLPIELMVSGQCYGLLNILAFHRIL